MTNSFKFVAALVLVCASVPAFAHGHGGGMSPGGNHPSSYEQNDRSMNHGQMANDKSTTRQQFNKLTPEQQFQVTRQVGNGLAAALLAYAAGLKAENKAEIKKALGEIRRLSELAFKDGFAIEENAGSGHDAKIGNLPRGQFVLDGKLVRI